MLKRIITEKFAAKSLIVLFSLTIVFHVTVFVGVIPMDLIWGGRLQTKEDLYFFESVSLLLNGLMLWVVTSRMNYGKALANKKVISMMLWLMVILFSLNTIGNLMAFNRLEAYIFTPITFLMAVLSLRLCLKP
ncbi:MAG: hypothetical protein EBR30_12100 [Cytophagia bacterium]|nr:hypothetical protein [Cytophagia bacterium]